VLGLPGLGAAAVGTALFLAIAAISVGAVRRAVSFETWQAAHILTYVAVVLSFLHAMLDAARADPRHQLVDRGPPRPREPPGQRDVRRHRAGCRSA